MSINGGAALTFTDPIQVFSNESVSVAGFEMRASLPRLDILDTSNSCVRSVRFEERYWSDIGNGIWISATSFPTSGGALVLTNVAKLDLHRAAVPSSFDRWWFRGRSRPRCRVVLAPNCWKAAENTRSLNNARLPQVATGIAGPHVERTFGTQPQTPTGYSALLWARNRHAPGVTYWRLWVVGGIGVLNSRAFRILTVAVYERARRVSRGDGVERSLIDDLRSDYVRSRRCQIGINEVAVRTPKNWQDERRRGNSWLVVV